MEPTGPVFRIRGVLSKALLAEVRRGDPPRAERVLAEVDPAHVAEIDDCLPVGFVSMESHMALSDAVREELGSEGNVEIWTRVMEAAFARPILRGFLRLSVDLFAGGPGALLRQGDRIYGLLTRGLGSLHSRSDQDWAQRRELELVLRSFPAESYRFITYVEGLQGCLLAALRTAGAGSRGAVEVTEVQDEHGLVRYAVRW